MSEQQKGPVLILQHAASLPGSNSDGVYALPVGSALLVGRAPSSHVRIDDDRVADQHALLSSDARGVKLSGFDVINGTTVNGSPVVAPVLLNDGDVISFGGVPATFHQGQAESRETRSDGWAITPEAPIGDALRGATTDAREDAAHTSSEVAAVQPTSPRSGSSGRGVGFREGVTGTVYDVTQPQVNVNPFLTIGMETDEGVTLAVRAAFWLPFHVPYVAAGHRLTVSGRKSLRGFLSPKRIENHTTGVTWRRRPRLLSALLLFVVVIIVKLIGF